MVGVLRLYVCESYDHKINVFDFFLKYVIDYFQLTL